MKETDYKVLMVDDDELIARSTSDYFNIVGVKTAYVTSYDSAIDFLEKNEVSLLLLDINLGDRSGFELCKERAGAHIRKLRAVAYVKALLIRIPRKESRAEGGVVMKIKLHIIRPPQRAYA